MTKDVLISIQGIQTDFTENDSVEMITTGQYYYMSDKHYINYIDNIIDENQETKTTIKIAENQIDIIRFGGTNTHMIFELGKKHMTHYATPFGAFLIGLKTKSIHLEHLEEALFLKVEYQLEVNHNFMSDHSFSIKVQSKDHKKIHLFEAVQKDEANREEQR